jgi:TRAP transporter TAXI family solute receptor
VIAGAISAPPALSATAVASNGPVANINSIVSGALESGFAQSDIAHWAYTGTGLFDGKPKVNELRAIANLYPETIHLVARKGGGIRSPSDLKNLRVSLDEAGSFTLIDARIILAAYGLSESDMKAEYLKPNLAGDKLRDGGLDAFFFIGGVPVTAIAELASTGSGIEIVPIDGAPSTKIRAEHKFFSEENIPTETYKAVRAAKTLTVGVQWVTSARIDSALVYAVTKSLWSDKTRAALDAAPAKGRAIRKETALTSVSIPLHPGAERFYKEVGLLK